MAPADVDELTQGIHDAGAEIEVVPCTSTTAFENRYAADRDERWQRIESLADPFEPSMIPAGFSAYVFGPLTAADMEPTCMRSSTNGALVAVDIQGLLRAPREGNVRAMRNPRTAEYVRYSSITKASRTEALFASQKESLAAAIDWFLACGATEILVSSGAEGSIIATRDGSIEIPAYGLEDTVDTTGCGDVLLAAYVVERLAGAHPVDAAHRASAAAGMAAATYGVPAFTRSSLARLVDYGKTTKPPH